MWQGSRARTCVLTTDPTWARLSSPGWWCTVELYTKSHLGQVQRE